MEPIQPKSTKGRAADERGTALIMTLLVLLVISSIGVGVLIIAGDEIDLSANVRNGEQALYFADAALSQALASVDLSNSGAIPNGFGVAKAQVYPTLPTVWADVLDPAGNPIPQAKVRVVGQMDASVSGFTVECNIPGYSLDYGQRRFNLIATAIAPGGTTRQVEAVVVSAPTPGLCPPGLGEQHQ